MVLATSAYAAQVGLVVTFPDGTLHRECINTNEGSNGYNILEQAELSIGWSGAGEYGHGLCQINGIGEDVQGTGCAWISEYWIFYMAESGRWQYSPVGVDTPGDCWNRDFNSFGGHYCARHGDVIGFVHGEFGTQPEFFDFNNICPLQITKVQAEVDGRSDSNVEMNEEISRKGGPESSLDISVDVKNAYTGSLGSDIEDITITGTLRDIDDGDDMEVELDDFKLSPGKDKTKKLSFDVPFKVEEHEYALDIEVEGTDKGGLSFYASWPIIFAVEKDSHNLRITQASFDRDSIKCAETASLFVQVTNLGSSTEDDVVIEVVSPELGLNFRETGLELDEDPFDDTNQFSKTFLAEAKGIAPGDYEAKVRAYYDADRLDDEQRVALHIDSCTETRQIIQPVKTAAPVIANEQNAIAAQAKEPAQPAVAATGAVVQEQKQRGFIEDNFLAVMISVNLLIVAAGALLILAITGRTY
ncbi:MAG: hypothetical protein ABH879_00675 [archaeon]